MSVSVLPCHYHSTSAPGSTYSLFYSYQKDRRADSSNVKKKDPRSEGNLFFVVRGLLILRNLFLQSQLTKYTWTRNGKNENFHLMHICSVILGDNKSTCGTDPVYNKNIHTENSWMWYCDVLDFHLQKFVLRHLSLSFHAGLCYSSSISFWRRVINWRLSFVTPGDDVMCGLMTASLTLWGQSVIT